MTLWYAVLLVLAGTVIVITAVVIAADWVMRRDFNRYETQRRWKERG